MRHLIGFMLLLALTLPALADGGPVEAEARLQSKAVKLGESLRVEVEVRADPAVRFKPPEPGSLSFAPWEVRDAVLVAQPPQQGRQRWLYTFRLAGYEPGDQKIPALKFHYAWGGRTRQVSTQPLGVAVAQPEPEPAQDIRDLKAAEEFNIPAWFWVAVGAGGLALCLVLIGSARALKRWLRPRPAPPLAPADWALAELDRIAREVELQRSRELYDRLTEVLRAYLARKYRVPVLERTTAELLAQLRESPVSSERLPELAGILQEADLVKFARASVPEDRAREQLGQARGFLESEKHLEELARQQSEREAPRKGRGRKSGVKA